MKKIFYLILFMSPLFLGSCMNRAIYTSPDFPVKAQQHQTIAILPFETIINLRPNQMRKLGPEGQRELEQKESYAVQGALYSYFLKEKGKEDFSVDFQDVHKTNALLFRNNITRENIRDYTHEELADLLGVDAIVSGSLQTDKPLSDGAAIALSLLFEPYSVTTNTGTASIAINDGQTGELLWRYHKSLDGGLGSDTYSVINAIMRKASRKLPYGKG
ncbi:hypothetical protein [Pontibacter cellulosilyticus]|uniref:Lipoprotein n=1 Tax=Pontibacter cellulosilyticus TaxID=1720253 RepID=A0A923N9B0_9BACT|nr:hypothetical protein [Pontibacter cellulosilyticus]MBC5994079.1 hypothetical protein [Pontibacter cellulosilyticus]